ncbi:titin homolog isoform X2 [Euwallacea fornicatus]|uniref:titin homolog isoform X2 n=1 Tax=Euwallacea fornicatus TaxID=995702 RepID=UPI00338FC187
MNSICRLCFRSDLYNLKVHTGEVSEFTLYSVDHRNEDGITITTLIRTLLPELYLGISANPRICNQCYESLKAAFSFRFKCLLTDKLIGIYTRESILPKTSVNLWDVVNYWLNIYCKMPSDANAARIAHWFGFKEKNFEFSNKTASNIDLTEVKIFLNNIARPPSSEGERCQAFVTIDNNDQVVNKQKIPGKGLSDEPKAHDGVIDLTAKGCLNEANIDFVHAEDDEEEWVEHIKILIDSDPEEGVTLQEEGIKIQNPPVANFRKPSEVIQTSRPLERHYLNLNSPVRAAMKAKCPLEITSSMASSSSTQVGRNSITRLDKSSIAPHVKTLSKTKTQTTPSEPCVLPSPPFFNNINSAVKSQAEHSVEKEENLQRLLKAKSESDSLDKTKILKPYQVKSEAKIIRKISSGSENLNCDSVTESVAHEKEIDSEPLLRTNNTDLSSALEWEDGNVKILNTKSITENEGIKRAQPAGKSGNCIKNKPILIKQRSAIEYSEIRPRKSQALSPGQDGKTKNVKNLSAEFITESQAHAQENIHDQEAIKSDDCFKTKLLSKLNDTINANEKLLLKSEVFPPRMYKRKIFKIRRNFDSIMKETTPDKEINCCQHIVNADNCIQTKIIKLKSIINSKENLLMKSQVTTPEISKTENFKILNTEPVMEDMSSDQEKNCVQHLTTKSEICDKTKTFETNKNISLKSQALSLGPIYRIENPKNLNRDSFTSSETAGTPNVSTQQAFNACSRVKTTTLKPKIEATTTKTIENLSSQSGSITKGMIPSQEKNPDQWLAKSGLNAKRKNLSLNVNKNSLDSQALLPRSMYTIGNPENLHCGSFTLSEIPDTGIKNTQQVVTTWSTIGTPALKPKINTAMNTIENLLSENESLPPELLCALENLENLNREITCQTSQYPANQTSNFDLIDIKDEPLDFNFDTNYDWNNFVKVGVPENLKRVIKEEDSEDTISASETEVENFLMSQNIPDVDLEPDIPDYVLITRRHPLSTTPVLENAQPSANDVVCEQESNNITISTENYSQSKPKPKAAPAIRKSAPVQIEEKNEDENVGMYTQRALYDVPHSDQSNVCVLYTNFTDNGDYINDHDYLVNPYMKNDLTTSHKQFGNMCICLLCGLKHASEEHIKHMQHHNSVCLICKVNFKNVFILNLHVRSHIWHCEECGEIVTYSRYEGHHKFHMLKRLTEQQRTVKLKRLTQKERAVKLKHLTEQERTLQTKLLNNTPSPIKCSESHDTGRRTRRKNLKGSVSEHLSTSQKITSNSEPVTLLSLLTKSPKSKQESCSNVKNFPHEPKSEKIVDTSCKHITLKTLLDNSIIAELKKSSLDTKSMNEYREDECSKNRSRKRKSTGLSATNQDKKELKSAEFVDGGQCSSWEVKVEAYSKAKRPNRPEIKKKKEDAKPAKNIPTRSRKGKVEQKEVSERINEVLHVKTNLKDEENSYEGTEMGDGSSRLPCKRQKRESTLKTPEKTKRADSPKRSRAGLKSKIKKDIQKKATISPRALRAKARSKAQLTELDCSIAGKARK